jgi:hypothetical protein
MGEAATELWLVGPFTLANLAGRSDISITKRYVHPEDETVRAAMDRAAVECVSPLSTPPTVPQHESKAACAVVASV